MYERILVPVDGSENSNVSLREAIKIAKLKITVMHVYQSWSTIFNNSEDALNEMAENEAKAILDDTEKIACVEGSKVKTLLVDGYVVEEIAKIANSGHFDLIVMGARGVGKLTELFLGSVSSGVLKNASCPVLITKH